MTYSNCFNDLILEFSELEQVEAILLAGSRGAERADPDSDYDVYVYLNRALPVEQRKAITDRHCQMMELNNQFWETEDDGVLNDGIEIELIYRDLKWLEDELIRVVEQYQVGVGYSTCFWANLLDSKILFDRSGKATALQSRFNVAYPPLLKQAIVDKCFPLMKEQIPAYYHQLKKALKREDWISVNHRIAEMLAAYFDILFAINEIPHPGEKRMLSILLAKGSKFPIGLEDDLQQLLESGAAGGERLLTVVERMTTALNTLLAQQGMR